jgi:prolyl-tRNA synthetase
MAKTALKKTREMDYSNWYLEVIKEADLAENSDVKGCIIFKPMGYSLWENIKEELDSKFKETGHKNVYFPLFIPLKYLQKEANHVEGFATECAVVTHHRLTKNEEGKLIPDGELAEPLVVRPTSETIIGEAFAKWVKSYRDLPIKINQWANVVRWEMRTRPFLRTTEFLWQEGHTAHETKEEAEKETFEILDIYKDFMHNFLAIPVICGEKTEKERFPGADNTYSIEAMMQNKKAIQAGTTHYLGQNFSKAAGIKFQNSNEEEEFAFTTSWGVTTRLIGCLIMTHSDDNGLVLPPKVAPIQIVILPIYKNDEEEKIVKDYIKNITSKLDGIRFNNKKIEYEIDDRDIKGGEKNWQWIKKGVPLKIEVGPRDVQKNSIAVLRRNNPELKKEFINVDDFCDNVVESLNKMQQEMFDKANKFLNNNIIKIDDRDEFFKFFTAKNKKNPEIHGGYSFSHWCGKVECEDKINDELSVSIRNIPLDSKEEGKCIFCGDKSTKRVIFSKAY